jgi:hypothetical protein
MKNCLFIWRAANLQQSSSRLYSTHSGYNKTKQDGCFFKMLQFWVSVRAGQQQFNTDGQIKKSARDFRTQLKHDIKIHMKTPTLLFCTHIIS